jgi:leucyl-tRNA synthetase
MTGVFKFANRVWDMVTNIARPTTPPGPRRSTTARRPGAKTLRRRTHQAIAKVTSDIAEFRFNTAVSALMIHSDAVRKHILTHGTDSPASRRQARPWSSCCPARPHIADELWEQLSKSGTYLYNESWPVADPAVAAEEEITVIVQINGKLVERLVLPADASARSAKAPPWSSQSQSRARSKTSARSSSSPEDW